MSRQPTKVEKASAVKYFEQVFRALYYRHEFARRNKRVYDAGPAIAKKLGMPEGRFKSFVQSGSFLTDEIIAHVEKSERRTKGARRQALGNYLEEFGIIPLIWTWGEVEPFFPRKYFAESHDNFIKCQEAFKSLLKFEAYALAVLKIGHPVMFPVMPLGIVGDNKEIVVDDLMLEKMDAPMIMDYSAPKTAFDSYIGLMSMDDEVLRHRDDMLLGSGPELKTKKQKKVPSDAESTDEKSSTEPDAHEITRLRISKLDQHLQVYDLRKPWVSGRRDKGVVDCYNLVFNTNVDRAFIDKNWGSISQKVSDRLAEAKPYVDGYRNII